MEFIESYFINSVVNIKLILDINSHNSIYTILLLEIIKQETFYIPDFQYLLFL